MRMRNEWAPNNVPIQFEFWTRRKIHFRLCRSVALQPGKCPQIPADLIVFVFVSESDMNGVARMWRVYRLHIRDSREIREKYPARRHSATHKNEEQKREKIKHNKNENNHKKE